LRTSFERKTTWGYQAKYGTAAALPSQVKTLAFAIVDSRREWQDAVHEQLGKLCAALAQEYLEPQLRGLAIVAVARAGLAGPRVAATELDRKSVV
jgi:hypothetical protein